MFSLIFREKQDYHAQTRWHDHITNKVTFYHKLQAWDATFQIAIPQENNHFSKIEMGRVQNKKKWAYIGLRY